MSYYPIFMASVVFKTHLVSFYFINVTISLLQSSAPMWEEFISKATKLHSALK